MPLMVVQGRYSLAGREPDGDSVHFYPDDPAVLTGAGVAAQVGPGGAVQLRLDAIDALETHYSPRTKGGSRQHQPWPFAHQAADELLTRLGFTSVSRDGELVTASTPVETPGHILTRLADKYGRPVALAYAGAAREADGSAVYVDTGRLARSANHHLLAAGLVYPTYYSKLYPDLRNALTEAVQQARRAGKGIWPEDTTTTGTTITGLATLTDEVVILPKLFRRLVEYAALGSGDLNLDGFLAFLAARDDRVIVIPDAHATGFDNLVEVSG